MNENKRITLIFLEKKNDSGYTDKHQNTHHTSLTTTSADAPDLRTICREHCQSTPTPLPPPTSLFQAATASPPSPSTPPWAPWWRTSPSGTRTADATESSSVRLSVTLTSTCKASTSTNTRSSWRALWIARRWRRTT